MDIKELYLKTIFCCMACDGDIAKEEIELVKNITSKQGTFGDINVEATINEYVTSINADGASFLKKYLQELGSQRLSDEEQTKIVDFAIQTIFADNRIEYSEVKFFKKIRSRLSLTDEQILAIHANIEDFLLPDINVEEDPIWDNIIFDNINFAEYGKK
ncbi:MAG: TerB family tellurite resistance protein [Prevotella sp.]|nr:TerB family tellurite resistance protein [Prevotella sp.]